MLRDSLRTTVTVAARDNVSNVALYALAFILAAVGVLILVASKCATNTAIVVGAGLVFFAVCLAAPAQVHVARREVVGFWRAIRTERKAS